MIDMAQFVQADYQLNFILIVYKINVICIETQRPIYRVCRIVQNSSISYFFQFINCSSSEKKKSSLQLIFQKVRKQRMMPYEFYFNPVSQFSFHYQYERPLLMNSSVQSFNNLFAGLTTQSQVERQKVKIENTHEKLITYPIQQNITASQIKCRKNFKRQLIYNTCQSVYSRREIKKKGGDSQKKKSQDVQGRNSNSNLMRMFFRALESNRVKFHLTVCAIIAKHRMKITFPKFEEWFEFNRIDHKNYVRLFEVKSLFFPRRQHHKQETQIMRILLKDFIDKQGFVLCLVSKKVKKMNIKHLFNSCRNILNHLQQS